MEQRGLWQAEIARRLGVTTEQFGRFARGERTPPPDWAPRLSPILRIAPLDI